MAAEIDNAQRGLYLTKSKFMLALECPTKLKYAANRKYANHDDCNEFMKALAEAGHQVGSLAKTLLGPGLEVTELSHDHALARTAALLQSENVRIFEAAFAWEGCFVRVDLLEKTGSTLRIYEVKAKSFDPTKGDNQFVGAKGGIVSEFRPYLYDVAFQRLVVRKARPDLEVQAALVFVNKSACSPEPVLQRLRVQRTNGRVSIDRDVAFDSGDVARNCLVSVPVDDLLARIEGEPLKLGMYEFGFEEGVRKLMESLASELWPPRPGPQCKSCQFRASADDIAEGRLDGRIECWSGYFGLSPDELQRGSILDLHNFRSIDRLIASGKLLLKDLCEADLSVKEEIGRISLTKRHWLQTAEARGSLAGIWSIRESLRAALSSARFPLHFIDFETARPVLPFHAARKPYEQILFQFSHHILDHGGRCYHANQFLHDEKGVFPNFAVLRALKRAIGNDDGSVIHWWEHERTVLSEVRGQLEKEQSDVADREGLLEFIDTLLGTKERPGRLLDIGRLVERTVFLPDTRGSSSLKKALPALLAQSETLQRTYSAAIYGAKEGIVSSNFRDHQWIVRDQSGRIVDPYKLLGERFADEDLAKADLLEEEQVIADGGAAMIAYSLLESDEVSAEEREVLRAQLLRYCELDTLAMVMAWDGIQELATKA